MPVGCVSAGACCDWCRCHGVLPSACSGAVLHAHWQSRSQPWRAGLRPGWLVAAGAVLQPVCRADVASCCHIASLSLTYGMLR
jgi:hypothetical protein